jgi:hypothetical protein
MEQKEIEELERHLNACKEKRSEQSMVISKEQEEVERLRE